MGFLEVGRARDLGRVGLGVAAQQPRPPGHLMPQPRFQIGGGTADVICSRGCQVSCRCHVCVMSLSCPRPTLLSEGVPQVYGLAGAIVEEAGMHEVG